MEMESLLRRSLVRCCRGRRRRMVKDRWRLFDNYLIKLDHNPVDLVRNKNFMDNVSIQRFI